MLIYIYLEVVGGALSQGVCVLWIVLGLYLYYIYIYFFFRVELVV